jgi:hypothetical protein
VKAGAFFLSPTLGRHFRPTWRPLASKEPGALVDAVVGRVGRPPDHLRGQRAARLQGREDRAIDPMSGKN